MNVLVDNLALNKAAGQSSTWWNWKASRAVDGRQDTLSCTLNIAVHPWWSVDLGAAFSVGNVTVTNDRQQQFGNYSRI